MTENDKIKKMIREWLPEGTRDKSAEELLGESNLFGRPLLSIGLDREGLLLLIAYLQHDMKQRQGYHEQCTERSVKMTEAALTGRKVFHDQDN